MIAENDNAGCYTKYGELQFCCQNCYSVSNYQRQTRRKILLKHISGLVLYQLWMNKTKPNAEDMDMVAGFFVSWFARHSHASFLVGVA